MDSGPVVEEGSVGADTENWQKDKVLQEPGSKTEWCGAEDFLLAVHFPGLQTLLQIASVFSWTPQDLREKIIS